MAFPFLATGGDNSLMQQYAQRKPDSILSKMYQAMQGAQTPQQQQPLMAGSNNAPPSFAAGGMMSAQGMPIRPGQPMPAMAEETPLGADAPAPMDGAAMEQEAQNFIRSHPQEAQKIQQLMVQAIQSGDLTSDELNLAVQLAKAALANPASYPQVRQFAIQNGLGTEAEIPQEMDRGLLFTLLVIGKTLQGGGANMQQGGAKQPQTGGEQTGLLPEYKEGGMTGDTPHIAKLHAREYVIPEDALIFHGKKTFDRMIEQAREPKDGSQNV